MTNILFQAQLSVKHILTKAQACVYVRARAHAHTHTHTQLFHQSSLYFSSDK